MSLIKSESMSDNRDLGREASAWASALSIDTEGSMHNMWLALAPWSDSVHTSSRLVRLNSDAMEPWIDAWRVFGRNFNSETINLWEEEHPAMRLWINFHNPSYEYSHYVDDLVHAAAHQNLQKFSNALTKKNDNRTLTENLPPWAAICALRTLLAEPLTADTFPDAVSELTAFARMLANPGTALERRRYAYFMEQLRGDVTLKPFFDYAIANSNLTVPFDLTSELALSHLLPLSIYKSALTEREVTATQLEALRSSWPDEIKTSFHNNISLGIDPCQAVVLAWSDYRSNLHVKPIYSSNTSLGL